MLDILPRFVAFSCPVVAVLAGVKIVVSGECISKAILETIGVAPKHILTISVNAKHRYFEMPWVPMPFLRDLAAYTPFCLRKLKAGRFCDSLARPNAVETPLRVLIEPSLSQHAAVESGEPYGRDRQCATRQRAAPRIVSCTRRQVSSRSRNKRRVRGPRSKR
jgi:hypothetical protein